MKIANIADVKNRFSEFLALVEQGEEVEVCKRNVPVAIITAVRSPGKNRTRLGCGAGSVKIHGDLSEPLIPSANWNMLTLSKAR